MFGAVLGLARLLSAADLKLNLTIPIVFALVATAWWGGRGPGILISLLFQGTTILYATSQEQSVARAWFGYLSVFSLYVFLTMVISYLKTARDTLRGQRDLLQVTLSSIGDAVIATDPQGRVTFMNPAAQTMTGWTLEAAKDKPLAEVFEIVNEKTGLPAPDPVERVLKTGSVVGLANHTILISRDGTRRPIDDSAAPIRDGDELKGVVLVFSDVTERKLAEKSRRENEIMHRIVEAQEAERQRIARDLHDHLGQKMTALRLQIGSLAGGFDGKAEEMIGRVAHAANTIDRDIGFLSWELRPTELEDLGLENALATFVREWSEQYDIDARFHASTNIGKHTAERIGRLADPVETNLYRIVQEALNNVLKHAGATSVNVLLQQDAASLTLIIEDDGAGFDTGQERDRRGLGLIGMHERAALLGGTFEVDSSVDAGTTIIVRVPANTDAGSALAVEKN